MFKVLIAEDEEIERTALRTLLDRGYGSEIEIVGEACTGRDAIDFSRRLKPHIVLMDIHMPVLDGLEAAQVIRQTIPDSVIVIVTAYSRFEYARQAIRIGVKDYLIKPYSMSSLTEVMDNAITSIREILEKKEQKKQSDHRLHFMRDQVRKMSASLTAEEPEGPQDCVEEIRRFIEANYREQITLDDISALVGLSKFHISRLFSRQAGMGIKEFVITVRLKKAQELLAKGFPVTEAAYLTGFSDPNYFSKTFKNHLGCTPSQYRRRK